MMRNTTNLLRRLAGPAIFFCLLASCMQEKQVETVGMEFERMPFLLLDNSNDDVRKWVRYFSEDTVAFQNSLERGQPYKQLVQNILATMECLANFTICR